MLTKSLNVVSNILLFHLFCKKQIKFSINFQAMFRLLYEILIGYYVLRSNNRVLVLEILIIMS